MKIKPIYDPNEHVFLQLFSMICGIFLISFIIWNRLIRERLPRDLTLDQMYSFRFGLVVYIFIICLFCLLISIRQLFFRKKKTFIERHFPNFWKGLRRMHLFTTAYLSGGPLYLWRFFFINGSFSIQRPVFKFLRKLGSLAEQILDWSDKPKGLRQATVLTVGFLYLPRILAFSIMLYEIAIYRRIEIFYLIAIILLIPIIFKCLRRMIMDYGSNQCEAIESECIIYELDSQEFMEYLNKLYSENEELLHELLDTMLLLKERIQKGKEIGKKVLPYIVLFRKGVTPPEEYDQTWTLFDCTKRMKLTMSLLYEIDEKYEDIYHLLLDTILCLSFGLWVLIIAGIY